MKTPDEIKKGLASCSADECHGDHADCPYIVDIMCIRNICGDAFAYIKQLEKKCHQLEREMDAIQADFNTYLRRNILKTAGVYACDLCKHGGDCLEIEELTYPDGGCDGIDHWEWRGVKEDDK